MRARAIVIHGTDVALIERMRHGRRYLVFPGGGINPGETLRAAAEREVREELGLIVTAGTEVAIVTVAGERHHVFEAQIDGGVFGTGCGAEMTSVATDERGSYRPVWLPIDQLESLVVYPVCLVPLVVAGMQKRWPQHPHLFTDCGS